MSEHDTPMPLTFRAELLEQLMPALGAGECCSLIGTSGAGKSNLVRFLQRPDVQQHYWGNDTTWAILFDTHGLVFGTHPPAYVVAELIIHRIIRECERRGLPADFIAELDSLHARLIAQPDELLAMRYLERAIGRLCEGRGLQLVVIFDQFEDIWRETEPRVFLNLRYLRDQFKYQLAYLAITREQLQRLRQRTRDDLAEVEAFWELFTSHVYGLGMYSEANALQMLDRIAMRRGVQADTHVQQLSLTTTGRHPGLLRAVFWALHHDRALLDTIPALWKITTICEECRKIWSDLQPEEQHLMQVIASGLKLRDPQDTTLDELRIKQLLAGEPPQLFSPIFASYVRDQAGMDVSGIIIDTRLRQVWLDGQPLTAPLSKLEFRLLEHLARNPNAVCSREAIMRELYQEEAYNANDERLDTLLRRLREALHEDGRNPRYLFTHRGVGVRLAQGRVQE